MRVTLESILDPDRANYDIDKSRCVIGRAVECDIQEPSCFVSQYHCELLIDDETVILNDLGSQNGTYVNGRRIDSECELHDGDRLVVAFIPFDVHIQPTGKQATAKNRSGGLWTRWSQILSLLSTVVI